MVRFAKFLSCKAKLAKVWNRIFWFFLIVYVALLLYIFYVFWYTILHSQIPIPSVIYKTLRLHGNWTVTVQSLLQTAGSTMTALPMAAVNGDYILSLYWLYSDSVVTVQHSDWWNRNSAVYMNILGSAGHIYLINIYMPYLQSTI